MVFSYCPKAFHCLNSSTIWIVAGQALDICSSAWERSPLQALRKESRWKSDSPHYCVSFLQRGSPTESISSYFFNDMCFCQLWFIGGTCTWSDPRASATRSSHSDVRDFFHQSRIDTNWDGLPFPGFTCCSVSGTLTDFRPTGVIFVLFCNPGHFYPDKKFGNF